MISQNSFQIYPASPYTDRVVLKKKAPWNFFFCNPLIKQTWKTLSNVRKNFFAYFNALEIKGEISNTIGIFSSCTVRLCFFNFDAVKNLFLQLCTWIDHIHHLYLIFDRKLRSGLSMSFFLLFLRNFVNLLYEIRKPKSLILDKKTDKSYLE